MDRKQQRCAVVIGGSGGIGLALVRELIECGRYVYVIDRRGPDPELLPAQESWEFIRSDLRDYDTELFDRLSGEAGADVLLITAGFGRAAEFECLGQKEIEKLFLVNAVAPVRIIRQFYERLKGPEPFCCGVIASIAGLVSSPLFSVYAAAKAAVCRFTESVNIELEESGAQNRILNISPGSIEGTRFNGGRTEPARLEPLAKEIVKRLFRRETLYIPRYEETYADVIARYRADAHAFGVQSYRYKLASGRMCRETRERTGYLSGTFDLFHVGHLNLLRQAKAQCDYLIVGVHPSGTWKGKETFIPLEERMAILAACRYVDEVVIAPDEDSEAWERYRYHKLFVGSDYEGTERFRRYERFFQDKDTEIVYFPYTRGTSSTQLRNALKKRN